MGACGRQPDIPYDIIISTSAVDSSQLIMFLIFSFEKKMRVFKIRFDQTIKKS
jgi:hypothetical protein